jgi:hypothetical protein
MVTGGGIGMLPDIIEKLDGRSSEFGNIVLTMIRKDV